MDIELVGEIEKLIQDELRAGRFKDAASLVSAAVRHFVIARELGEEYTREEIEEKISRGLAQLERGEGIDGDEFFEKLGLRAEELRRQRA